MSGGAPSDSKPREAEPQAAERPNRPATLDGYGRSTLTPQPAGYGMGRVFGSLLVFAGWASIPLGATSGLIASKFLGLNALGEPFLATVYGFSAAIILWVFVAAALMTAIPMAMAMFSVKAHRSVYATAAMLAIVGVGLLPDELGRSFGIPLAAGAAAMAWGGHLLVLEAKNRAAAAGATGSGPAPTWVFDTMDLSDGRTIESAVTADDPSGSPTPTAEPAKPAKKTAAIAPGRRKAAAKVEPETVTCEWCSANVPASATTCPACGVVLKAPDIGSMSIPGVTEVSPALRAYAAQPLRRKNRSGLLKLIFSDTSIPQAIDAPPPSDAAALQPPSRQLRAEMARLDAEIAAGLVDQGREGGKPAAAEPAAAEPAAAEPAATEPAATEPAATEPAATEPAATEPAAAASRRRRSGPRT